MKKFPINRRTLLRGVGTSMALPLLEVMIPAGKTAFAQALTPPKFVACFTSMGFVREHYDMPVGPISQLSKTLSPFENIKDKITQVLGMSNSAEGFTGGEYARGTQAYLRPGGLMRTPVSIDQVAHQAHMASQDATRFGSLAICRDNTFFFDGNSQIDYTRRISWEGSSTPKPPELEPHLLFNKLFSGYDPAEAQVATVARRAMDESVLSLVMDDAKQLQQKLGAADRQIMEKYLTSFEELERRIKTLPVSGPVCIKSESPPELPRSAVSQRLRAFSDLAVLALECDQARYLTFMLELSGDIIPYVHLSNSEGHYDLYQSSQKVKLQIIEQWLMEELAYFIQKLNDAKDPSGRSLLDSCLVTSSCDFGNPFGGGFFSHINNMPMLMAGSCNGYFKTGQTIQSSANFADLWVRVLNALGYPQQTFGNSQGNQLDELIA